MSDRSKNAYGRMAMLLLAGMFAACGKEGADASAEATPAGVTIGTENVVVVETATLRSGPGISGTLAAEREATVSAQLGGTVLQTMVDQGSRVGAGTVLARIDDRTIRESLLSARSAASTAQSVASRAARELERFTKLSEAGAIAERELESARSNSEAAQSQLADAKARLVMSEKQLSDAQVRAPFAGIVAERRVNTGDLVNPGTPMFMIVDPRSMRFEGSVPADQLSLIRTGAPVNFTVAGYPGKAFEGKIARINPMADAATGQVRIVVTVPNERNALVGGLFADGRVSSETRTGLTAPFNAVDMRGVKPIVLRLTGGKTEKVEVELGVRDEERERVELVTGVAAGDTLLTGAAQGITPGTVVRVSAPSDKAPTKS
ncbi:MAG: efflux RND transporter periplasmic adaptor subunit [Gemmatimonadaceae bacterium]|nr:efflux RND transporter periplasmic adaptor subunit [Gemmatimonadaceae bacterium]